MKLFFLQILCILLSSQLLAQEVIPDSSINCIAFWKNGESKTYLITRIKEKLEFGQIKSKTDLSYEVQISVIDSTDSSYTIQWISFLNSSINQPSGASMTSPSLPIGMKILFTTSETGAFKSLQNWKDIRDFYVKMLELSLPKTIDSAGRAAVDKSLLLFSTKETAESMLIKEVQLFHSPYGYEYSLDEVIMPAQVPTPLSKEPLPSIMRFRAYEPRQGDDHFSLTIEQDIDKAGAEKLIKDLLGQRNPKDQSLQETMDLITRFEIKDSSHYQILSASGWLKKVYHKRSVITGEIVQIDSCAIELKD